MRPMDWILLGGLSLLWGGSFLLVEIALLGLPPFGIVWGRVALAAVILGFALWATGGQVPHRQLWPALGVMGLLNNALPFTLLVLAQGQITGALAAVLNATTPLFTVVVAHVATTDERLNGWKALGLTLGFAGVLVLIAGETFGGAVSAIVACLAAALSYALAGVWGRRFHRAGLAPMATAFGQVSASTLLMTPLWLWQDRPWALVWPGAEALWAVVGLGVLSTALAYQLYFHLLARAGATAASLVTFLIPLAAAGLGGVVLGERLEAGHLVGLVLILAGLGLIQRRGRWVRVDARSR